MDYSHREENFTINFWRKKNLFIFFLVNSSKKHHIRLHSIQFKLNWKCKLSILRFLVVRFWIHFFSSWHRIYNSVMFTILVLVCVCEGVCLKMIMMINNKKKGLLTFNFGLPTERKWTFHQKKILWKKFFLLLRFHSVFHLSPFFTEIELKRDCFCLLL